MLGEQGRGRAFCLPCFFVICINFVKGIITKRLIHTAEGKTRVCKKEHEVLC